MNETLSSSPSGSTPQVSDMLRRWFVIHFVADLLFAVPLFIAPTLTLAFFGWESIDPLTARLVGSALMGIGIESLLGKDADAEVFLSMLTLKCIWSISACVGIALSIFEWGEKAPWGAWLFLGIFLSFSTVWNIYRVQVSKMLNASAES